MYEHVENLMHKYIGMQAAFFFCLHFLKGYGDHMNFVINR